MKRFFFFLLILAGCFSPPASAQQSEGARKPFAVSGQLHFTNNGIAPIQAFSLGEPAVIFNPSISRGGLSLEPEFRSSLEGSPWMVLLWFRYQVPRTPRFAMRIGAHAALNFKPVTASVAGADQDFIAARRYLAYELAPNFFLTKSWTVGMYYLYSHGFESNAARNMHYITFNTALNDIRLSSEYSLRFNPQFYVLLVDGEQATFLSETLTLGKKNFPWSVSSIVTKRAHGTMTGSEDLVWNVTLTYSYR